MESLNPPLHLIIQKKKYWDKKQYTKFLFEIPLKEHARSLPIDWCCVQKQVNVIYGYESYAHI